MFFKEQSRSSIVFNDAYPREDLVVQRDALQDLMS